MEKFDQQGNEFLLQKARIPGRLGEIYSELYMACNTGEKVVLGPNQREWVEGKALEIFNLLGIGMRGDTEDALSARTHATALTISLAAYINTCRG